MNWRNSEILVVLLFVGIIFVSGCLGGKCKVDGICKGEETYQNCPEDCPDCDDRDNCTLDYFDYELQECVNGLVVGDVLFYDNFSTNENWELPDTYDTMFEMGKMVLRNSGSRDRATPVLEYNFDKRNYIVEFSAKVDDLIGIMSARYDLSKNYSEKYALLFGVVPKGLPEELPFQVEMLADYEGRGIVGIGKSGEVGLMTVKEVPVKKGEWHDYKVVLRGDRIEVYVDEVLYENYTDSEPIMQNGGMVFEGLGYESRFSVDYVRVTEIC